MKKLIAALLLGGFWLQTEAANLNWGTDLPAALTAAKAEKKLVLLDFTGSDWCVWCMRFERVTLNTDAFANYANANLKLVLVDFPYRKPQGAALKAANNALANKYDAHVFPTFILLDADGKVLGRQTGYAIGGPDSFIREIKDLKNPPPPHSLKKWGKP